MKEILNNPIIKKLVKISDDKKSIISKTKVSGNNNNFIKLYSNDKFYLENLQREIHLNTDYIAKKMKNHYIQEFPIINGNKKNYVDLAGFYDNELFFMAEYKRIKNISNIDKEINSTFEQLLDYVNKYFENNKNNIFNKIALSIVVFDDKWLKEPTYIDKFYDFLNINDENLKPEYYLKNYGIFIETHFFDIQKKELLNKKMYNFPIIFKTIRYFNRNTNEPLKEFKEFKLKPLINFKELEKIPTRTSDFKITNSRENISFKDYKKKMLILDIMDTILEGYNKNNTNIMRKYSKDTSIVFLEEETLGFIKNIKADEQDNITKEICILSSNLALIDGQQSFNTLKIIKNVLTKNELTKEEKSLKDLLIQKIANKENIKKQQVTNEFLNNISKYIELLNFYIEIIPSINSDEAKKISKRKNNNIPQEQNNILLLEHDRYFRFLNSKIFEKYNKKLYFPNVTNYTGTVLNYFPVYGLINLYEMILKDKIGIYTNNFSNIELYIKIKQKFNKFKINKENIEIIKILLQKKYQNVYDEDILNLEIEKNEYQEELNSINDILLDLIEKNHNNYEIEIYKEKKEELKNILKKINLKINELKEKNAEIIGFRDKEIEKNIFFIFDLANLIINTILNNDQYKKVFNFNDNEITEYWIFIIIGYLMKKTVKDNKKIIDYNINDNFINNNISLIINGLIKILNYPEFNITNINNKNINKIKKELFVTDKEGNKISYYDLFENFLSE